MEADLFKFKIIAVLVGILGGTQSLTAKEAKVLTNVYATLPKVTNLQDKEEIAKFLENNFDKLSQETIATLNLLISENNSSKKVSCGHPQFANYSNNDNEDSLSKVVMCMND